MELISIKGVSKSFKKHKILEDINFSINKGEIFGIVGPSGSGKSVLIKILIKFLKPTSGEIIFNIAGKNKIGFSMQNNSIYKNLTTKQNLEYFSKIYGLSKKERIILIPEIISSLNLTSFEKVLAKNLSGGTKKRLDIGCALVNKPEIIILDEPFLGLDPELISGLSRFLISLNKGGATIIISSHRVREMLTLCSRIGLVKNKTFTMIKKQEINQVYR